MGGQTGCQPRERCYRGRSGTCLARLRQPQYGTSTTQHTSRLHPGDRQEGQGRRRLLVFLLPRLLLQLLQDRGPLLLRHIPPLQPAHRRSRVTSSYIQLQPASQPGNNKQHKRAGLPRNWRLCYAGEQPGAIFVT